MEVWVDPSTNRIMATYSGSTKSTVWSSLGYVKYGKVEPWMLPKLKLVREPAYPEETVLQSPNGKIWRVSITNTGKLLVAEKV